MLANTSHCNTLKMNDCARQREAAKSRSLRNNRTRETQNLAAWEGEPAGQGLLPVAGIAASRSAGQAAVWVAAWHRLTVP